jgi:hypothetical protein
LDGIRAADKAVTWTEPSYLKRGILSGETLSFRVVFVPFVFSEAQEFPGSMPKIRAFWWDFGTIRYAGRNRLLKMF